MSKTIEISARNYCFILYPESCPDGAIGKLLEEKIDIAISPLHHGDKEDNKPHYHVLVCYKGKHKQKEVSEYFQTKYNCTKCIIVADRNKYTRYLIHLDDVEKEQFTEQEIMSNYDIRAYLRKECYVMDIIKEINARKIASFTTLVNMYTEEERFSELEKVSSKAVFFKMYFDKR